MIKIYKSPVEDVIDNGLKVTIDVLDSKGNAIYGRTLQATSKACRVVAHKYDIKPNTENVNERIYNAVLEEYRFDKVLMYFEELSNELERNEYKLTK